MSDSDSDLPPGAFFDGHPVIRSRKNDRLRLVRALGTRRGRKHRERFLVEGPKPLQEVLSRDPSVLEQILVRVGFKPSTRQQETVAAAQAAGVPVYPVQADVFDAVAPSESPQGVIGVGVLRYGEPAALLAPGDGPQACVACLGVQDPGNLGTILRTARFFGFDGCLIGPTSQDPYSPKVVRAAAGALFASPPATLTDLTQLPALAAAGGYTTVALDAHDGAPLGAAPLPARALILLGAEGPGLPDGVEADLRITIPGAGRERLGAESLNVAIAFALVAHRWRDAHPERPE